ncbi:uncharacterized protein LOC106377701 [Brassica napus]|uniref:uncharacterized protein LOC106377701 n=1 Tax=Brassica napus TaxID=3708 RepID=UPI0006AA9C2A|nr:uncharacterized protein LOC106377701 [Brassica napus]
MDIRNDMGSQEHEFHHWVIRTGFGDPIGQAPGYDPRRPIDADSQREDPSIPNETRTFQNSIERNDAKLKRIHTIVHMVTSSAPNIDLVIEETRMTPFRNRIASVRLHHVGKLKFPEYAGNTYQKAHVRVFRLAISRAHLNDDEKEAGYCRFFAENLTGTALEWFAGLEENSIDNFTQLVSTFLKQYSVFIETRVTEADLWNLKQAPFEPLRAYIDKYREIKAKISHPNEVVALAALNNGVWFSSKFREEMAVRAPISLDDALHRASYFASHEEEVAALKENYSTNKNNVAKKTNASKEPATKGQHSYTINNSPQNKSLTYDLNKLCAFHNRKGHSTEECRAALRNQNENKETSEDAGEEEEAPATPKTNRKTKGSSNQRNRESELESPSSPLPAPKKRVVISWGPKCDIPNKIEGQTERKMCIDITIAICTLEDLNGAPLLLAPLNTIQIRSPPSGKSPTLSESIRWPKYRNYWRDQLPHKVG